MLKNHSPSPRGFLRNLFNEIAQKLKHPMPWTIGLSLALIQVVNAQVAIEYFKGTNQRLNGTFALLNPNGTVGARGGGDFTDGRAIPYIVEAANSAGFASVLSLPAGLVWYTVDCLNASYAAVAATFGNLTAAQEAMQLACQLGVQQFTTLLTALVTALGALFLLGLLGAVLYRICKVPSTADERVPLNPATPGPAGGAPEASADGARDVAQPVV